MRRILPVVVAALAASCQTYDFEPVTPLAIAQTVQKKTIAAVKLKPDIMILLDKSGSMASPLTPGCGGGCAFAGYQGAPACNENTCPTRMGQLRSAMTTFLTTNGDLGRMGLTIFPADNVCTPSGAPQQLTTIAPKSDSSADLKAWAADINTQIQSPCSPGGLTCPGGGTPTAASLQFVGTLPELSDAKREDFVLLLTDGLPNCNMNNPNACTMPTTCRCTLAGANCGTMMTDSFCRAGCLDLDGAVQAVKDLRARDIQTIVVGFGSDFGAGMVTGDGFTVLNAMAVAGGFARTCPMGTSAECGTGGVCDTTNNVCQTAFYAAANGADLAAALAQISAAINASTICDYPLQAQPTSADLVSVIVDDVPYQSSPDTWTLTAGHIILGKTLCDMMTASTTEKPVKIEIRIVQSL